MTDFSAREARRREMAAQALAESTARMQAEADKGMKHPGADMVRVFSVAGFELADVFREWTWRANEECGRRGWSYPQLSTADAAALCDGLGPPWPIGIESPEATGDRYARAILRLIKEV